MSTSRVAVVLNEKKVVLKFHSDGKIFQDGNELKLPNKEIVKILAHAISARNENDQVVQSVLAYFWKCLKANLLTPEMLLSNNVIARLMVRDIPLVEALYEQKLFGLEHLSGQDFPAVYVLAYQKAWPLLLTLQNDGLLPLNTYFMRVQHQDKNKIDHALELVFREAPYFFRTAVEEYCTKEDNLRIMSSKPGKVKAWLDFFTQKAPQPLNKVVLMLNSLLPQVFYFNDKIKLLSEYLGPAIGNADAKRGYIRHFIFSEMKSAPDLPTLDSISNWLIRNILKLYPFFIVKTPGLFSTTINIEPLHKLETDIKENYQAQAAKFEAQAPYERNTPH